MGKSSKSLRDSASHIADPRTIRAAKNKLVMAPVGKRPKVEVRPETAVINHRGDIVPRPAKRVLDKADELTSVIDGVEALPGNMWDSMGHVFAKDEGQSVQSHVRTARPVRVHAQFVKPWGAGTILHHLHLSRAGTMPESHEGRFVLGRDRKMHGRTYTEAHPLRIRPDGRLEVDTRRYVLIEGSRYDLKDRLHKNLKEREGPIQVFRKAAYRFLGIGD